MHRFGKHEKIRKAEPRTVYKSRPGCMVLVPHLNAAAFQTANDVGQSFGISARAVCRPSYGPCQKRCIVRMRAFLHLEHCWPSL